MAQCDDGYAAQADKASGKEKYVDVILHEDGRKMRLPELALRLSKSYQSHFPISAAVINGACSRLCVV